MDAVGTSRSSQLGLARLINQVILRIAPTYRTFVCFWFTFAFLGEGRSFRLTERRSGLALKNFAKVLLLFQISKDTVFSCAGACTRKNVIYIKNLTFLKIEYKGSGLIAVSQYHTHNSVSCRVTKFISTKQNCVLEYKNSTRIFNFRVQS